MGTKINPSREGRQEVLRSREMAAYVAEVAERVAEKVRADAVSVEGVPGDVEIPVTVDQHETDRARASVSMNHPAGLAVQAKHGLLTKAASEMGLEIVEGK